MKITEILTKHKILCDCCPNAMRSATHSFTFNTAYGDRIYMCAACYERFKKIKILVETT